VQRPTLAGHILGPGLDENRRQAGAAWKGGLLDLKEIGILYAITPGALAAIVRVAVLRLEMGIIVE
jgi:hypothetical protein